MSSPEYDRFARFYDDVSIYQGRPDVPFFVEMATEASGRVLEVGCGTGRVLIPTARAGVTIEGLDSSGAMLEVCRATLAREPEDVRQRVRLHQRDMRSPQIDGGFRLITLPFRCFLHLLTINDQIQALTALRDLLERGGRLVLDIFNPSLPMLTEPALVAEPHVDATSMLSDGSELVRSFRIVSRDHFTQTQVVEFIFELTAPDGTRQVQADRFPLRHIFRYEAEHLLERCGFRVDALYAGYEREPYGSIHPGELVFVASRR